MSAFKRYKSKVFWGHMESHDLQNCANFQAPVSPLIRCPGTPVDENFNLNSIQESDSTDGENTTVICVEKNDNDVNCSHLSKSFCKVEDNGSFSKKIRKSISSSTRRSQTSNESRSPSTASRGQRSQDSGFSDSDSSGGQSLDRQRKRRNSRKKENLKLATLESEPEVSTGPVHTSTPKKDPKITRISKAVVDVPRKLNFSFDSSEEGKLMISPDEESECLNDFLFTDNLPQEEVLENPSFCAIPSFFNNLKIEKPISSWLSELRKTCEDECNNVMEFKSLPQKIKNSDTAIDVQSRDLKLLTASAFSAATKLLKRALEFHENFTNVTNIISNSKSDKVDLHLLRDIESDAVEILAELGVPPTKRISCNDNLRSIVLQLGRLKYNVDRFIDKRLDFYIEKIVRGLEDQSLGTVSTVRGALAAMTALGLAGPRAGASIARCSGIKELLISLSSSCKHSCELRASTLRALASVCCCLEAIDSFVQEGGPETVTEIIIAEEAPLTEKTEAVALLVQIISPWMNFIGLAYIEGYANLLIPSLTRLAEESTCLQTLLLTAASLNYLSRSKRCISVILNESSVKRLLRCVKKSGAGSVCLMEQVASMIGQLAKDSKARKHLVECRVSVALVCFLRLQPPGLEEEYKRLIETTTDAITRLCVEPEIARQVVAVGGYGSFKNPNLNADSNRLARNTQSLRVARKIATEQIDMAKISDGSY